MWSVVTTGSSWHGNSDRKDDFRALIEAERRQAHVCTNCEAETFACTACGARVEQH